jgi:hypothetical protein
MRELCKKQAEAIKNGINTNVNAIGQGEAMHRKYKRLSSAVVRPATVKVTNCNFGVVK